MRELTNEEMNKVIEIIKNNDMVRELVNGMLSGGIDWDKTMYSVAKTMKVISE